MSNYILTKKATEDLSEIWDYTFDFWSENQADIYYNMLIASCEKIAIYPDNGKNYEGIMNLLFGYKVGRHIIFYRKLSEDKVEIVRILHEQMDLKSRIKD